MADKSKIEWTDATWNPVRGCTKVSPGCAHCYAETLMERFRGTPGHPFEDGFDLQLVPKHLNDPLKWRTPRRVFVNSLSDLFHEGVPDEYIDRVFAVMALTRRHTYQVLTKRPERMREYLAVMGSDKSEYRARWDNARRWLRKAAPEQSEYIGVIMADEQWPLPNVWLGVSCEDQQRANERIPLLLQTPAAVRFVSCEPLLGPVDLTNIRLRNDPLDTDSNPALLNAFTAYVHHPLTVRFAPPAKGKTDGVNWVIVGGESGRGARPMHPAWVRSLRDQCVAAGVPFFFKQWGEWSFDHIGSDHLGSVQAYRVGKKAAGRLLDDRTWDEFPTTPPTGTGDQS